MLKQNMTGRDIRNYLSKLSMSKSPGGYNKDILGDDGHIIVDNKEKRQLAEAELNVFLERNFKMWD